MAPGQDYWLRVWAARGLLWAGPGDDIDALRSALADDSWRVREMTCKVVARHRVGDLLDDVVVLESDPVSRVRSAAVGAARRIVEAQA
jgi:HEAT repeat protein